MEVLRTMGWDDWFAAHAGASFDAGRPGRVVSEQRGEYRVRTADGEVSAILTGRVMRETAGDRLERPVVGDWVIVESVAGDSATVVRAVLPRRTILARRESGRPSEAQPVAANVDIVFIVVGLDGIVNLRRLERFLAAARESGAEPVILLTKSDMAGDPAASAGEASSVAPGVRVLSVSSLDGEGVEDVRALLTPGVTACFIGPSGVGKSTLVNRLAGGLVMATGAVRERDAKGRHTTTHRQLILLPGGGIVIDTPGMREFGLWQADEGIDAAFPEIAELSAGCRFHDCSHRHEPGCAVRTALADGGLDPGRYGSYLKLRLEEETMATLADAEGRRERKKGERRMAKGLRAVLRKKGKK